MSREHDKLEACMEALQRIFDMAANHPAFDEDIFDSRDWDGLVDIGGDICDWTTIAIIAADAMKD